MGLTTSTGSVSHYTQVDCYTGVTEADPHQLVQMLLDGALGKIAVAKGLMSRNETAQKGEVIGQVISIVGGLRASLDMSAGGEIAANLNNLYEYIERRLLESNLKNDASILDETGALLREVKTAWESIPQESRSKPETKAVGV
ncbi:MAG: flagellar export chaperone FliS [Gammaproteobacteria bacterium]